MARTRSSTLITKFVADDADFNSSVNRMQKKTKSFGQELAATARNLARIFIVTAATGAAIKAISGVHSATVDFTRAVGDLKAITGASGKDLEFMKDKAFELGNQFGISGAKMLEAFKIVGSVRADLLGNAKALAEVTKQVTILSKAADIDVVTSSNVLVGALNQYKLGSEQAARVADILAIGSREGAAEVDNLGRSLQYVGPVAAQVGISLEKTVAILESLAEAGIKNEKAGTGLRAVLLRLSTQADSSLNPSLIGWDQAMENLQKRMDALPSRADRVSLANDLFGRTAVTAGLAALDQAKKQREVDKAMSQSGVAVGQAKDQMDNYAGSVDRLSASFSNLGAAIGDSKEYQFFIGTSIESITGSVNKVTESIRKGNSILGAPGNIIAGAGQGAVQGTLNHFSDQMNKNLSDAFKQLDSEAKSAGRQFSKAVSEGLKGQEPTFMNLASLFGKALAKSTSEAISSNLISSIPSIKGLLSNQKQYQDLRDALSNSGAGRAEINRLVGGGQLDGKDFLKSMYADEFTNPYRDTVKRIRELQKNRSKMDPKDYEFESRAINNIISGLGSPLNIAGRDGYNVNPQLEALRQLKEYAKGNTATGKSEFKIEITMKDDEGRTLKHLKLEGPRGEVRKIITETISEGASIAN